MPLTITILSIKRKWTEAKRQISDKRSDKQRDNGYETGQSRLLGQCSELGATKSTISLAEKMRNHGLG